MVNFCRIDKFTFFLVLMKKISLFSQKILLKLVLLFFTAFYLHNAWYYSPNSGYDAGIHMIYTRIITWEQRIPLPIDTPESYNPPMFYFLSGQLARVFMPLFNNNFLDALKSWQILIALLMSLAGYLGTTFLRP